MQIKVYPTMEYHDQPMQFISNHYFKVKSKDDSKYKPIVRIIKALTYLPLTLMPLISFLTIIYVYPRISCYVKQYSKIDEKDEFFLIKHLSYADTQQVKLMQVKIAQKWKTFHLVCLFLTICAITTLLLMLHISSAIAFIDYGNEILHDEEFLIGPNGYHYLPYMHAAISCFLNATLFIIAIGWSIYKRRKNIVIATLISLNIIYIMCYFFPTLLFTFIYNPLRTILTCFMAVIVVGIIYAVIWSLGLALLSNVVVKLFPREQFSLKVLIYSFIALATAYSIFFFFALIIDVIILGSFSDFQALQNDMIVPLLVGLLSFFIVKPAYKYACKYAKVQLSKIVEDDTKEKDNITSNNQVEEVHILINQMEDNHDTETEEMNSQNDENTII